MISYLGYVLISGLESLFDPISVRGLIGMMPIKHAPHVAFPHTYTQQGPDQKFDAPNSSTTLAHLILKLDLHDIQLCSSCYAPAFCLSISCLFLADTNCWQPCSCFKPILAACVCRECTFVAPSSLYYHIDDLFSWSKPIKAA